MIRLATEEDMLTLLNLARDFTSLNPFCDFNMERVQAIISQMMNSDDGLVVVMEKDSKVVGLIVGHFSEHPMFGTKCTTELVWYVDFNYRGTKDSLKLLKAYIEWAEYKGSELVFVSDLERKGTVERIYTKLGFTQVEISYARRL